MLSRTCCNYTEMQSGCSTVSNGLLNELRQPRSWSFIIRSFSPLCADFLQPPTVFKVPLAVLNKTLESAFEGQPQSALGMFAVSVVFTCSRIFVSECTSTVRWNKQSDLKSSVAADLSPEEKQIVTILICFPPFGWAWSDQCVSRCLLDQKRLTGAVSSPDGC